MDKTGKTYVIARANEFIYFGNFYKCQIEVAEGEKWEIIHKGGSFTVLKRGKVTIELCSQDFPRYFEQYAPKSDEFTLYQEFTYTEEYDADKMAAHLHERGFVTTKSNILDTVYVVTITKLPEEFNHEHEV